MRRIVRTIAASIVIILGLALVSAAAFTSDIVNATLPKAPTTESEGGEAAPLDPNLDNGPVRKVTLDAPDIFVTEFGKRGKHEVTVTMSGPGFYHVQYRNGNSEDGAGVYNTTKTVVGGFPLALIAINGAGHTVSCTITIDGVKRDTQTTTTKDPIVFCEG